MLKRLLLLFAFLVLCAPTTTFAQAGTIVGTVTDAQNQETIPGANVTVVDLQTGAVTDADGNYRIGNVPEGTYTLRVSFVGYQSVTREVTVNAGETTTVNAQLETGAVGLDEVVVTGYGEQRTAGEISGSITRVGSEEIENVPAQNVEGLLQGRSSGISVAATSGNPGSGFEINIRGQSSINAGSRPLYIIDGQQVSFNQSSELTDRSPLNSLDPNDIESIQVLKDAAAAAIYGAQAANGVVLIETKSGSQGGVEVSVNFEGGVRFQSRRLDMANRDQWVELQQDAFEDYSGFGFRDDILPAFGYDSNTPVDDLRDFQWQDWLFDPGLHSKVGFSANGGDEDTQFFLSGNYTNTGGAVQARSVDYKQYSIRSNLDQQVTEDLDLSLNLSLSNEKQRGVCQDGFFINCPFYQAIGEEPPISYPYLDNGEYNPNTEQAAVYNPALVLSEETRIVNTTQFRGNLSPTYQITSWLTARGTFGLDWQEAEETDYGTPTVAPSSAGELSRRYDDVTNLNINATLNADRTFGNIHDVRGLIGTEYRREFKEEEETGFQGFNNNLIRVPAGANETSFFQGFNTEYRILSYFGRVNYSYDARYVLTFTGRYDGSSRFGTDRRWGFFPSGSIAWRITQESFFDYDIVETLKLRASYGVTGNSLIGGSPGVFNATGTPSADNYAARGLYDVSGSYLGQVGIRPDQLANPDLSWEENTELNFGLDWSLWEGRVSGDLNFYRSKSTELLLNRPLPESSGFGAFSQNIGELRNQGIEVSLQTVNVQSESFRWSTRVNFSVNQNEVLELTPEVDELNPGSTQPVAEGHSIQTWKVPLWAGVNPADGRPMWYDEDGNLTYQTSEADRQFYDGAEDDVTGGFGTTLQYQGLSLDLFFDYAFGGKALPYTEATYTDPFGENVLEFVVEERWKEPGDVARYPKTVPFGAYSLVGTDDADQISTNWLYKTNYVRLKSVRLGYSVPESVASRLRLSSARVYVSGLNLAQWSPWLGIDPEVAGAAEQGNYPTEQQINFGIRLTL